MDQPLRSPHFSTFSGSGDADEKGTQRSSYVLRTPSHRNTRFSSMSNGLPSPQQPFIQDPYSEPPPATTYRTEIPKSNPVTSAYLSLGWMFGFREKWSLLLFFIFPGALLGFCLARSMLMDAGQKMRSMTVAGEFFWFELPLYKYNYIIHIWTSISYFVILTVFISNVCGAIVTRRSFGGELNSQAVYYITAIMSNFSLVWAIMNVKRNTRTHRKWMIRGVVYFSVVISARIIGQAAHAIVTDIGSYYSIWRCDEILFVLQDLGTLLERFPQCSDSPDFLSKPTLYTTVHASDNEGKLGSASVSRATQGMILWIATLLHVVGVEIYLRWTEEANSKRHGYALEPKDFDPDKDLYSVHY